MNLTSIPCLGHCVPLGIPRGIPRGTQCPYRSADCKGSCFSRTPSYLDPVMKLVGTLGSLTRDPSVISSVINRGCRTRGRDVTRRRDPGYRGPDDEEHLWAWRPPALRTRPLAWSPCYQPSLRPVARQGPFHCPALLAASRPPARVPHPRPYVGVLRDPS